MVKGSAGGKATAIIRYKQSVERYYNNPKHCQKCGAVIEVAPNQRIQDVRKKKFCTRSCAASFNGKKRVKLIHKPKKRYPQLDAKYRKSKSDFIDSLFGSGCFFCGHTKVRIIHRKDGVEHKRIPAMSWGELYDVRDNHKDEYIRVCGLCHAGVHWCMSILGMNWNDIMARRTTKAMFG